MSKQRSPNCPQISFEEASAKGRIVYGKEHTHPAPREAIAISLGYGGLNGRSQTLLGSLRQYGILEASGEGLRVSEDAVTYFELEEGEERDAALERMVYRPQLFASLREQFGETLPSESTLKHHLIKLGFLPRAAEDVIAVYRENEKLVEGLRKSYSGDEDNAKETAWITPPYAPTAIQLPEATLSIQTFSFPLSPDAKADLQLRGPVGIEELELLREHINLMIRAWQMEGAAIRRKREAIESIVHPAKGVPAGQSPNLRLQSRNEETMEQPNEDQDFS